MLTSIYFPSVIVSAKVVGYTACDVKEGKYWKMVFALKVLLEEIIHVRSEEDAQP
jgi:hypothetical protein